MNGYAGISKTLSTKERAEWVEALNAKKVDVGTLRVGEWQQDWGPPTAEETRKAAGGTGILYTQNERESGTHCTPRTGSGTSGHPRNEGKAVWGGPDD